MEHLQQDPEHRPTAPMHVHNAPRAGHVGHDHAETGLDKHAGHSVAVFRDRFWRTLLLTIPTLVWSDPLQRWLHYQMPQFPWAKVVPAFFGFAVFFYGGAV